jgi:hypothetical protein
VKRAAFAPLFFAYGLLLAGCATETKTTPAPAPVPAERKAAPAARYNLTGYSVAFKEGYSDACASPRRRSEQRYKSDTDYQMGWNDGQSLCRAR